MPFTAFHCLKRRPFSQSALYANWIRTMNDLQTTGCTVALPDATGPTAGLLNMSGYCFNTHGATDNNMALSSCITLPSSVAAAERTACPSFSPAKPELQAGGAALPAAVCLQLHQLLLLPADSEGRQPAVPADLLLLGECAAACLSLPFAALPRHWCLFSLPFVH